MAWAIKYSQRCFVVMAWAIKNSERLHGDPLSHGPGHHSPSPPMARAINRAGRWRFLIARAISRGAEDGTFHLVAPEVDLNRRFSV